MYVFIIKTLSIATYLQISNLQKHSEIHAKIHMEGGQVYLAGASNCIVVFLLCKKIK